MNALVWGWQFPEGRVQVIALYGTSVLMVMDSDDVRDKAMRWGYETHAEAQESCVAQAEGAEHLGAVMIQSPVEVPLSLEATWEAGHVPAKTKWTEAPFLYAEMMAVLP